MADPSDLPPQASAPSGDARASRAVSYRHAFDWYRDAMVLWKRGPVAFGVLAFLTLATQLVLEIVPRIGFALAQLITPLVACGLLYASLAADRGERPRVVHLFAIIGARPAAIAAIVISALATFCAEALTANLLADFDLTSTAAASKVDLHVSDLIAIYAVGVVASLPLSFVPFVALFDNASFGTAFRSSIAAFVRNVAPLLVYGVLSLMLLLFGLVTNGVGLLVALPWWAASSYAAWKDVFSVDAARTPAA